MISIVPGQISSVPRVLVQPSRELPRLKTVLNKKEVPLARKLALALAALKSTRPEAGKDVMQVAVKDVSSILSAPLAPPTNWATLTDSGEDVVVAHWSGNSIGDDPIPVMLWDDSISDTLIFQCRVNQMKSPELFAHVIDELFTWNTRRLYAARLWLRYPPQPGDSLIGGGESGSRGQFIFGPEVVFSGFADGQKAYFGISLVSYFPVFPPDMKLINERFPPLRQRIKHWTTQKLVAETKRSVRAAVLPDGTTQRNQLLVGEAVARDDLTVTMFEDLLTTGVGNRLGAVTPEARSKMQVMLTENIRRALRADGKLLQWPMPPTIERLPQIKAPTLVFIGTDDEPDLIAIADLLVQKIPSATKVVLPAAKHHLNLDQPQKFDQQARDFLAGLSPKW